MIVARWVEIAALTCLVSLSQPPRFCDIGFASEKTNHKSQKELPGKESEGEKTPFTSWGKEIDGLQAGLGFHAGQMKAYRVGDSVKLVVRVRNVGKRDITFQYVRHFFIENPPLILDSEGRSTKFSDGSVKGIYAPLTVLVEPGRDVDLYELSVALIPETPKAVVPNSTLAGAGKYQIQYERVFGETMLSSVSLKLDSALRKLGTGKLELKVHAAER
jgi:hypothetical protein